MEWRKAPALHIRSPRRVGPMPARCCPVRRRVDRQGRRLRVACRHSRFIQPGPTTSQQPSVGGWRRTSAGVRQTTLRPERRRWPPRKPLTVSGLYPAREEETLIFGAFELFRSQRVLARGGEPLRIGGRALDILIALAERSGEVVSKRELMTIAWPHAIVEESNLRVHIVALRKLLGESHAGDRFITNVAGRGYIFTASVTRSPAVAAPIALLAAPGMPEPGGRLIGRALTVRAIVEHALARRFVTIVGSAGVGKSAVAVAVGEQLSKSKRVCFVDLTPVVRPELLASALAAGLEISVLSSAPLANLIAFLRDQTVTIILDNCEHLTDDIADLLIPLLQQAPGVAVLATSREPIRTSSEFLFRLEPFPVPARTPDLTAVEAMTCPAIQLFVERASGNSDTFEFTDRDASAVAEICRRLDGVPLAIELIAARVDLFGIGGLATGLEERLMLSARGARRAAIRGRSIRDALDWSYDLLSPAEQTILCRFSVFRGPFSLESATSIAGAPDTRLSAVLDALASLSSKSLIVVDTTGPQTLYRLLNITRTYAAEKLFGTGEKESLEKRHAHHFCALLTDAEKRWETMSRRDWLDAYGYAIEDVRRALDWGFSRTGDPTIAASLMVAALPYGFQLSLLDEFRLRAESALQVIDASKPDGAVSALRLTSALCVLNLNASIDNGRLADAFDDIVTLCARIPDTRYKVEPLLARAVFHIENGAIGDALDSVSNLAAVARKDDDPLAILATDRIWAQTYHFAGRYSEARALAERVIRHPAKVIPLVYSQATIDRQVTMRIVIARSYWIEGRVDEAGSLMHEALEIAGKEGPLPLTFALAMGGCLLPLWMGDAETARPRIATLLEIGARYTLERWERLGDGYAAALRRMTAVPREPFALDLSFLAPVSMMQRTFLATAGLDMLNPELVAMAKAGKCGWCQPEILRLHALRVGREEGACEEVLSWFRQAIATAQQQGALSWELRAATSLAELLRDGGQSNRARDILEPTLLKLHRSNGTVDYRCAELLLNDLA